MIFENPEDLGYFTDHEMSKQHRSRDLMSSLIVCNAILADHEQADISHAALLAHQGYDFEAERQRRYAGYDDLGFREDADRA